MDKEEPLPLFDPLGAAFEYLRTSESSYFFSELAAPWALVMPKALPKFHVVVAGECWIETTGVEPIILKAGSLVVLPHGKGHRMSSALGARMTRDDECVCTPVTKRYGVNRKAGPGEVTKIICGDLRFSHPTASHLISLLPKILHVPDQPGPFSDWLRNTLQFIALEARDGLPGSEALITRLADTLVIQAIRAWIERNPEARVGWLAALNDKRLSRALGLMHREPYKRWTVASLAQGVAMSRSAFAARFSELVGESAIQYLTRWRMHVARSYLHEDVKGLSEIAELAGYRSVAAFSRAFKRFEGKSPGELRRAHSRGNRLALQAEQRTGI